MSEFVASTSTRQSSFDEIVECFEDAWHTAGTARVEDYIPSSQHPQCNEITLELLCIDLERRFKADAAKSIRDYKHQFPSLLKQESNLERLAYEEYRLRLSRGERPDPATYARQYGIPTRHWPRARETGESSTLAHSALAGGIAEELGRVATLTQQAIPESGEQFLSFRLGERLGECRFGSVFLARQCDLADRQVVIKITSNLWSESDRLAKLQHTHIVPVYSVHKHGGLQAVCMPYLGQQTLSSLFDAYAMQAPARSVVDIWYTSGAPNLSDQAGDPSRAKQLAYLRTLSHEEFCAWTMAKVASALSHAHERGILHRDLKPANILMTDDLRPMILDFNLSEDAMAGGRSSLLIGGTLPYMAPEHLLAVVADGDVDERSDVYSLGVMLFQLLTGQLPFRVQTGSTIGALNYLIHDRYDIVPAVRAQDPELSIDIESIVLRCLASKPSERYQTAQELQEDLERHLQQLPLKFARNRSRKERLSKWLRRHPSVTSTTAIAVICSVLLLTVSVVALLRGRQLARLEAAQSFHEFKLVEQKASAPLSVVTRDASMLKMGLAEANSALGIFAASQRDWKEESGFRLLSEPDRIELARRMQRLQFMIAAGYFQLAKNESTSDARKQRLHRALRHNKLSEECRPGNLTAVAYQREAIRAALAKPERLDWDRQLDTRQLSGGSANLMAALQQMQDGNFATARTLLLELQGKRSADFFVWYLLGNCNYALNRLVEADSCFTACLALWPESPVPYVLRGHCRLKTHRWAAADQDFTRAIEMNPELSIALINRAVARMESQRPRAAIDDLTRAISDGQNGALAYLLRARAYASLGDIDRSELDLKAGMESTPTSVEGWIQRGLARREINPIGALQDFETAIRQNPKSRKALQNKVALLSQLQRNTEAVQAISRLLENSPDDATALLGRGLLKARLGQREAALADGRRGLELNASPGNHYQMARILAHTDDPMAIDNQEAISHVRKALAGNPAIANLLQRDPDMQLIASQPAIRSLLSAASKLLSTEK